MAKLSRKRKPPTVRAAPVTERLRFDAADGLLSLQDCIPATTSETHVHNQTPVQGCLPNSLQHVCYVEHNTDNDDVVIDQHY